MSVPLRSVCLCALLVGAWFTAVLARAKVPLVSLGLWTEVRLQEPFNPGSATLVEEKVFSFQEGKDVFSPKNLASG